MTDPSDPPGSNPNIEPGIDTIRLAIRRGKAMVAGLVILVALTAIVLYRTDLGEQALGHLVQHLDPISLIAAGGLISLAFYFMALRWRALLPRPHHPPATGLTAMICTGLLINYTVPGPVGELGAAWCAHRRYKIPLADALASGITARLIGLGTAALLATVAWLTGGLVLDQELARLIQIPDSILKQMSIAMGVMAVLALIFILRPKWWGNIGAASLAPFKKNHHMQSFIEGLQRFILDLSQSVEAVRTRGIIPIGWAGFWALCGHATVIAGIWVAAVGLGANPSLAGIVFTYASATAMAIALFAFPGSQLGWDVLFGGLLMLTAELGDITFSHDPQAYLASVEGTAAAIVLLVRVQQLAFMLLGAVVVGWFVENELHMEPGTPQQNRL